MMKFTDVILQTATKVIVFIILTFSVYLFFAGHHNPGGGFIGGLVTASALVLLYMAFGVQTVQQIIPLDFKLVAAAGALLVVVTGVGSFFLQAPFLSQGAVLIHAPLFGEVELSSAVLFDLGVYLAVVGVALTIIQSISEDG